jgi:UV DNA damage endonuclease|tara:strand:- start:2600 stop:3523 length:924 start_codon:yes stop_codon:yes gene_type:complete
MAANYGYCCINLTLEKERGIKIGRSMIKRTFKAKGIEYAGELAEANLTDMIEILKWNTQQGINLYRMSSNMFPWMSEYELSDLPNFKKIKQLLETAGKLAIDSGQRIGFHPGQFCVLPSPSPHVVENTINELDKSAQILDLMCLPQDQTYSMNIHLGGSYGDKESAMERFVLNFKRLSKSAQNRIVLENDDKPAQYSVLDLYEIYKQIGTPITFDYHHHRCYNDPMPEEDALKLAATTWPDGIRQLCHYSSAKKLHEDETAIIRAHADYLYERIETYGMDLDIELEVKAKELALIKYRKEYLDAVLS